MIPSDIHEKLLIVEWAIFGENIALYSPPLYRLCLNLKVIFKIFNSSNATKQYGKRELIPSFLLRDVMSCRVFALNMQEDKNILSNLVKFIRLFYDLRSWFSSAAHSVANIKDT